MDVLRGRIITAKVEQAGSATSADAFAAATSVLLEDAGDFSEEGGLATLYDGSLAAYSVADMDADELTFPDGLPIDVPEGKFIGVSPTRTQMTAEVALLGHDEPLVVLVPHHLRPFLTEGARDSEIEQEECSVIFDGQSWLLFDVQGVAAPRLSNDLASPNRIFRYTMTEVGPEGYEGVKLTGYRGHLTACKAVVAGAPSGPGDFWVNLLVNGGLEADVQLAPGDASGIVDIDPPFRFVESDVIRIEVFFGAGYTAPLKVYVYATLDAA